MKYKYLSFAPDLPDFYILLQHLPGAVSRLCAYTLVSIRQSPVFRLRLRSRKSKDMAASSGFATIHTSAEADEDATYTFNRDGVRLEVATYEFPRKIIVNSSSHTKKYHWRRNGGNYHISDNRENAEPADGKAQFLEIGRILSGDEPGRYLFKKMRLDKPEKDAWRSGSKFLKDSRALPVFVKCSKYLPTQAKILVGYRRDAETRLLDLEGVDIDNVFFYQEILTPEILASPVHDRIPKTTSKVREFAAEIKMKNPDSVPKLTIVNSTTDTTSMLSQFSVSELDHVDDTIRMMLDAIENSESDTTPLQAMHAIMEQRLLVVRTPSTDMMAKFVDDETYFSLEDTRKLQHELKVCRCPS